MRGKFTKNTCLRRGRAEPQKVYLRTKNSQLRAFLLISVALVAGSCFDKGDCLFVNTTVVKVALFKASARTTPQAVTFSSIHIPNKLIFVQNKEVSGTLALVVDPSATETKYVFQYGTRSDTLVLGYNNQSRVLAPSCGSVLFQSGLEIKHSTFPENNVVIVNQNLLSSVATNISMYF